MELSLNKKSIKRLSESKKSLIKGQTKEVAGGVNAAGFRTAAGCTSYARCH
ncbi:hypothetical protein [Pseudoalteromonas luteoviolacea]|uniref:Uncharacterized protein n=1 Tax=Pseudoalteromonas luteoviolacea S4060-1 TaxID=1365257 RepID=A0A167L732_9GAMM|nr:hypothetical protein [Pseudoalteromonas luteoviolacea]KZN37944.1 hypothetical protein N480_14465 [Pseudoalteromonas luteoviolacea S2607]KZN63923.1 hypothetical protein N478_23535 [Pseudoalteromonas luteoviolacea S4060-1]